MFERFTASARAVLITAQHEARDLGHNFIGTEHIALGVLQSQDATLSQVLGGYEFTLEEVRDRIAELIGPGGEVVTGPPPFTPRAKKVLELSLREALAMGHDHIGPSHVLLGILREGEGVGFEVLSHFGLDYDRARLWVAQNLGERQPRRRGRRVRRRDFVAEAEAMLGTPPTRSLPRAAAEIAGPHEPAGTHHYLLALLAEETSLAAKVLDALGVTREQVEAKVADIGIENTSDAPPRPPAEPKSVTLAEGVEVRITDPELAAMVESGTLEELLKEIVRRSQPES